MTDRLLKVWLPGAASCLLFFGFYFALSLLPFLNDRFWFIGISYLAARGESACVTAGQA
jgi:hypothetical protein